MLDIKFITATPNTFMVEMEKRGLDPSSLGNYETISDMIDDIILKNDLRREFITKQEDLQARKNKIAGDIGKAKRDGKDTTELERFGYNLRREIEEMDILRQPYEDFISDILMKIPNILHTTVPDGMSEDDNKVLSYGTHQPRVFGFDPLAHDEIGVFWKQMDFQNAVKISGPRFTVLSGDLARLERALGQFMLEHNIKRGFNEFSVPALVGHKALFGTGQLPKFKDDLFQTVDGRYLIPTAEVPLTNLVAESVLNAEDLPLRMTALTNCFRAEAGSAGRDVSGMLRQHQFQKVELVSITKPERSMQELEWITETAESILEALELPFRRVLLCAGDTGFSSSKTYDLEVWMPGQNKYREISSCSNMRDFQARRMDAKFKENKTRFYVHTLNGSGLAIGRTMIAIMENYQNADGTVNVPDCLYDFMKKETIGVPFR